MMLNLRCFPCATMFATLAMLAGCGKSPTSNNANAPSTGQPQTQQPSENKPTDVVVGKYTVDELIEECNKSKDKFPVLNPPLVEVSGTVLRVGMLGMAIPGQTVGRDLTLRAKGKDANFGFGQDIEILDTNLAGKVSVGQTVRIKARCMNLGQPVLKKGEILELGTDQAIRTQIGDFAKQFTEGNAEELKKKYEGKTVVVTGKVKAMENWLNNDVLLLEGGGGNDIACQMSPKEEEFVKKAKVGDEVSVAGEFYGYNPNRKFAELHFCLPVTKK